MDHDMVCINAYKHKPFRTFSFSRCDFSYGENNFSFMHKIRLHGILSPLVIPLLLFYLLGFYYLP